MLIGSLDGVPVYDVEPVKDTETIVVDMLLVDLAMPGSRQAFPISYDV